MRGLTVTRLARTVCDLASLLDTEALEIAIDSGQRRFRRLGQWLAAELRQRMKRGVAGARELEALLAERCGGVTDSALEVRVWRLLRRSGLPAPLLQHTLKDGAGRHVLRLDFAWLAQRVALHVDGYRWHSSRTAFDHDAHRSRVSTE